MTNWYISRWPLQEVARFVNREILEEQYDFQILPPDGPLCLEPSGQVKKWEIHLSTAVLPERFRFLEHIGPQKMIVGLCGLGSRQYKAYVFGSVSILECDQYGNALYIVRTDQLEELANKGKKELRRCEGFVAKVSHFGKWQERVMRYLSAN